MSQELLTSLTIFVLAILVGFEVISKVPATLHTPLMSGANSIHGIVLVGAMFIAAAADNPLSYLLAFVAMVFGAMNVVGGYVVTDRMLQMFRRRPTAPAAPAAPAEATPATAVATPASPPPAAPPTPPAPPASGASSSTGSSTGGR
jgi:NAD(P) transhydrogenase subunit alpha